MAGNSNSYGLKRFEGGRPLAEQLTAERLNQILDAVDKNRVNFGDGMLGMRSTGGTTISTRRGRRNAKAIGDNHPFKLLDASTTSVLKLSVYDDSYVFKNKKYDDLNLTGIGTPFSIAIGEIIWVETTYNASFEATGCQINNAVGGWNVDDETYPEPFSFTNGTPGTTFHKSFFIIGLVVAWNNDNYEGTIIQTKEPNPQKAKVVQVNKKHLLQFNSTYEGKGVVALEPWIDAYPKSDL